MGRSPSVPTRAADLRLDDVDIVAAIGDSDTAAFAAGSGGLGSYLTDYWGLSYSTGMYYFVHHPFSVATIQTSLKTDIKDVEQYCAIGTDGDWNSHPSLANLIRTCNPGLEGGSQGQDSVFTDTGGPGQGLNCAVR